MLRGKRNENKEFLYNRGTLRRERRLDETNRAKMFSNNLKAAIKRSGLSMREIEKKTMIDSGTLYNYTRGFTSPKAYNVLLLSKVLKSSFGDLYPI